ncbi:hypothetical protein J6590_028360 [Homalodisca vitripennis]|nr:hypothetical protein J6590_028360 [Homalodisca vitripennis]
MFPSGREVGDPQSRAVGTSTVSAPNMTRCRRYCTLHTAHLSASLLRTTSTLLYNADAAVLRASLRSRCITKGDVSMSGKTSRIQTACRARLCRIRQEKAKLTSGVRASSWWTDCDYDVTSQAQLFTLRHGLIRAGYTSHPLSPVSPPAPLSLYLARLPVLEVGRISI